MTGAAVALASGRADRLAAAAAYLVLVAAVGWLGAGMLDRVLARTLVNDWLRPWRAAVVAFAHEGGRLVQPAPGGMTAYMRQVVAQMKAVGIQPPAQDGRAAYQYQLGYLLRPQETVLLVATANRMTLYGLSRWTAQRLDQALDGQAGTDSGSFVFRPSAGGQTMIGTWMP